MSGCNCGDPEGHARAVSSAILECLLNQIDSKRPDYWAQHADKLERKFTTDHGRHYSLFLNPPAT